MTKGDSQGDMFSEAYARRTDLATSHEAALRVDATKREADTLCGLKKLGGTGTSREIARAIGVHEWSISPRMKPLERKGLINRTDERRDNCIVWRLT